MAEENGGGGGGAKKCGIACLILIILLVVGGIVATMMIKSAALGLMAAGVEGVAEVSLTGVNQADHDEVMGPIKKFGDKIREGEVSMEQGGRVLENLTETMEDVGGALRATTFDSKFLQTSELSADEKKAGHIAATRYAHGKLQGKITGMENSQIGDILMETKETTNEQGQKVTQITYKESLTTEEVKKIVEILKKGADDAAIEDKEFDPDFAAPLQAAIDKGMEGT